MNPLWSQLYDEAKDKRYGRLFLVSLVGFFGVLLAVRVFGAALGSADWFLVLLGLGVLAVSLVTLAARRTRVADGEILPRAPLSRDELRAARSKLLKDRNRLML